MKEMDSIQSIEVNQDHTEIQVVVFRLGKEEYAMDILHVQEIIRVLHVTRIPRVEKHIAGVVNLRGNIIPLLNLHTKFNLHASGSKEERRIIVCQFDEIKAGIIVDEVLEVIRLNNKDIEMVADVYTSIKADQIKGVAKISDRLLILPDMKKIFISNTSELGE